jgi:hypothetical protein
MMQARGQTEPANSVENRCATVHHNGASALPVKQNARMSARRRGSKENGVGGTPKYHEPNHSINGLWVQSSTKMAGWRRSMAGLGAAHGHVLDFEELVQHLGPVPSRLPCAVREAVWRNTGYAVRPCADFTHPASSRSHEPCSLP